MHQPYISFHSSNWTVIFDSILLLEFVGKVKQNINKYFVLYYYYKIKPAKIIPYDLTLFGHVTIIFIEERATNFRNKILNDESD